MRNEAAEKSMALPAYCYGDPAIAVVRIRSERKKRERLRKHKALRIQALVKQVLKGKRK